jgi:hypothetical protein
VVARTTVEGADLASVRLVGVGIASNYGGWIDRKGRCSGLCSLGRRGLSQPLWWRERQLRALLWPLFGLSEWEQPDTDVAGTTREGAAMASVRLVGVGSDRHCGGGHDR